MPALLALFLSPTALKVYAVIAAGLFLLGLKSGYDSRHEEIGAASVRAEYAPVAQACDASLNASKPKDCAEAIARTVADAATLQQNNAALSATIGRQNDALARLGDAEAKARAAAAHANKQADAEAVFYADRLKGLRERIDHQSGDPNADADRILRALAIDRLHGH